MAVKVLIRRKFREGHIKDAARLLIKARTEAMGQQGYISSETLSSADDPNWVTVVSTWQHKSFWDNWVNSEARRASEAAFEELLDRPTECEVYELGLQS
jgi:heme-degrading monooxygenase HmoA